MIFTAGEISYIGGQRLGRLATIQPSGDPQVNPVSCYYNPDTGTIDIGGRAMTASRKYRNVLRNPRVAVVIDDMAAGPPPRIRCLEIRGSAEALPDPDHTAARTGGPIIRVHPERIISWASTRRDWRSDHETSRPVGLRTADSALSMPGTSR